MVADGAEKKKRPTWRPWGAQVASLHLLSTLLGPGKLCDLPPEGRSRAK